MSEDTASWKANDDTGEDPVETVCDSVESAREPELVSNRT